MPATVIAERIGWERSMTVLNYRVRELRRLFVAADPCRRTEYRPGADAVGSVVSAGEIPVGHA
jgi:hypothetical protein